MLIKHKIAFSVLTHASGFELNFFQKGKYAIVIVPCTHSYGSSGTTLKKFHKDTLNHYLISHRWATWWWELPVRRSRGSFTNGLCQLPTFYFLTVQKWQSGKIFPSFQEHWRRVPNHVLLYWIRNILSAHWEGCENTMCCLRTQDGLKIEWITLVTSQQTSYL